MNPLSQRVTTPAAGRFISALSPCLIAIAAVLIAAIPGAAERLQFDRAKIFAGEWYRLLTCHLSHFGLNHLTWDTGALLGLGITAARIDARRTLAAIGLSAITIPLAILQWQPAMQTYRGLSGIDSAVFTLLGVMLLRQAIHDGRKQMTAIIATAGLGFIAKMVYELFTGHTVFVDSSAGFVPVPLAHCVGAVCGVAMALEIRWLFSMTSCPEKSSLEPPVQFHIRRER